MTEGYKFWIKTDARFGEGESQAAAAYAQTNDCRRVAVIIDVGLRNNEHAQHLLAQLHQAAPAVQVMENAVAEPDYDYLDEFRQHFDAGLDLLIGIGGGSTIDLAKAMSVLATNPGPAISYRGFNLVKEAGIPLIALPTTAGTGSEVTPNAVFIDKKEMRKLGINTSLYVPTLAILDPLLTISCPRSVTLSSGLDAMVQSIENFTSNNANQISRVFSQQGFALSFRALPAILREPNNVEWRAQMQLAAFLSGIGLMNSGGGIAGALSYTLGTHYGVPHGLAHAIFTPPVIKWNVARGWTGYTELYDAIDGAEPGLLPEEKNQDFVRHISSLFAEMDAPQYLGSLGLSAKDIQSLQGLLRQEMSLLPGALEQNPIPFTPSDLSQLLESIT